jgi:hypothetical protein
MTTAPQSVVRYSANRLTIEVGSAPAEFQSRYEQAVPLFPAEQVAGLVRRQAPWQDMLDLMAAASPVGFFLFYKIDVAATVRLAGDKAVGVAYLMGNNTLMESMYRYEPAILLYAPLHIVIWGDPDGPGYLTFDKPSDQFGSFGNTAISTVGAELDHKLAALLDHLGVSVPAELRTT